MKTPEELKREFAEKIYPESSAQSKLSLFNKVQRSSQSKCLSDLNALIDKLMPTEDEIETAALDYRDKSDDENTDEDDKIQIHWYDKQDAFMAGIKWFRSHMKGE